jgi:hypothetical protein
VKAKIKVGVLEKGDSVLSVTKEFIAVKRKNGEVDLIKFYFDEKGLLRIDTLNIVTIGYGKGDVTEILDEKDSKVVTF